MKRSMKWLAMVVVLGLAGLAVAADADYVIQLNRPAKVGDECHLSAISKETTKDLTTVDGKAQPDMVREQSITLDGMVKVLEVDKNGKPSKVIVTVEKCLIRLGADETPLAKGTVITGAVKDEKCFYEVDGKPAEELNKVIGLAIPLVKGKANADDLFGTKDRKKVGDSWAINTAMAVKEVEYAGIKASQDDFKGTVTVEKAVKVGDTECLQLKCEMSATNFNMTLPPNMKMEKSSMSITVGGLYPVDTSKGPLESTGDRTIRVAIRGKPQADGPEVTDEMTSTLSFKFTCTYPK